MRNSELLLDILGSSMFPCSQSDKPLKKFQSSKGITVLYRRRSWDSAIIAESFLLNEYARQFMDVPKNPEIIDIGAHIGAPALFFSTCFRNPSVYSFEPDPRNYEVLLKNIECNDLGSLVVPSNLAVGAKSGQKIKLYVHPSNTGMSSINPEVDGGQEFEVNTISLEDIFKNNYIKRCHLLKVDCEGAEYAIFRSLSASILKRIDRISLEYHKGGDVSEISRLLEKNGFVVKFTRAIPNKPYDWVVRVPLLLAWKSS